MTEFSDPTGLETALPILSRGKHSNQSQGACFMEYTSLLAGEAFTDQPRCVDGELAAVLRGANDRMSDADRTRLVPLLGRAIGLGIEPPPKRARRDWSAAARRVRREQRRSYDQQRSRLCRAVSERFMAAVGCSPSESIRVWSGNGQEVGWLFWDLMSEPTAPRGPEDYVDRLVDRLGILHECYEHAMRDLGLAPSVPVRQETLQESPPSLLPAL